MKVKWKLVHLPRLPSELVTVDMAAHDLRPLPTLPLPPVVGGPPRAPTMTGEEFRAALMRIGFRTHAEFASWAGVHPTTVGRWIRRRPPTAVVRLVHAIAETRWALRGRYRVT